MATPLNILVEVSPLNGSTPVTLRLASLDADNIAVTAQGFNWTPCINLLPKQSVSLSNDGLLGNMEISRGDVGFIVSNQFNNTVWPTYKWGGAFARIWVGLKGAPFSEYAKYFEGKVSTLERTGNEAKFALLGAEADLTSTILSLEYLGTGGIEGPANLKGVAKPRAYGNPRSIEPVEIDPINLVYQVHAYGAVSSITPYEYGSPLLPAQNKGNVATYAALIGMALLPGEYATCLAQGLFRFGGTPTPKITADITMPSGNNLSDIAEAMLLDAGVNVAFIGDFSAFDTVQTNFYITQETQVLDALFQLFRDAGGYVFPDSNGVWQCGRFYNSTKTALPLKADRSSFPVLLDWKEAPTQSPVWRVRYGFDRCWGVHSDSDASPIINDLAGDLSAAQAAAEAAQTTANAANSSATAANTRLASMADDNVLDRADKFAIIREYQDILSEQPGIDARAAGFGITTERTTYNNAVSTLTGYLTGLSPAWNNTAVDTPIVAATFRQRFSDVYLARQVLLNRFAEIAAQRATVAGAEAGLVNSNIGIVSGNITGIGAGNGTPVSNGLITVDGNGILSGIGTANINVDNRGVVATGTLAARPATGSFVGQTYLVTSGASLGLLSRWSGSAWVDGPTRNTGSLADLNAVDLAGGNVTGTLPVLRADNGLRNNAITIDGSGIISGIGTANIPVNNALIPSGNVNLLRFSRFEGGRGWTDAGGGMPVAVPVRAVSNAAGTIMQQDGAATAAGQLLAFYSTETISVIPGQRLSVSANVGVTTLSGPPPSSWLFYLFALSNGSIVDTPNIVGGVGNQSISTRQQGFYNVPAGIDAVLMVVNVLSAGAGSVSLALQNPMIAHAAPNQTVHPAFTRGQNAVDGADVTAQNTAAAISGQGPWATSTIPIQKLARVRPNLFPYPWAPVDGRLPSQIGWQNSTGGGGSLGGFRSAYLDGSAYVYSRPTGGGAVIVYPFFDMEVSPNLDLSVGLTGYGGGNNPATFNPYIEFLNAAKNSVLSSHGLTYNSITDRFEVNNIIAPANTAFMRIVCSGNFPSSSQYQDIVFWAIKVERGPNSTPISESSFVRLPATEIEYNNGANVGSLRPAEFGSNVTETRVASAISGQGDLATRNAASLPFGANSLVNTEFTRGKFGWNAGNGSAASEWGVNLPGWHGHRNVMWARANGVLANGSVRDVSPAALWEGLGLADAPRFALPVQQGDRVYASVLAARHRCNFQLYILTFNSAGTLIDAPAVSGGVQGGAGNGDPASFERVTLVREMQPNARWAIPMYRLLGTGENDPFIFFTEPAFGKMAAGQTAIPAYVQGRGDPNAEVSISISGPNSASFNYTSTGDLDPAAQMPATLVYRLNTTSGPITSGITWQYRIIEGTVNSTSASSNLINMTSSAGAGQLVISNLLSNSAQIEIVGSTLGVSVSQFLTLSKVFAAPPTGGGGGGGPASASQTSGFTTVASSTYASVSNELQVTSTTTTQTVNVQLTFTPPNNADSTSTIEVLVERWNGSAWVAMGASVTTNTQTFFDIELNRWVRSTGSVNFSRTATITAGSNQRTRVRARLSAGTASHTTQGTLTLNA